MRSSHDHFHQALASHYPGAVPQVDFVGRTAELLAGHTFTADTTLACVAACRDELAGPLLTDVESRWGPAFSLVSLAGMLTAGRTGFSAATHHAPINDGRRRLVLYAMPHIAISAQGVVGEVVRPGVPAPSPACGALTALQAAIADGSADPAFDPLDAEQSLLAGRLLPAVGSGSNPDLVELTNAAAAAIDDDSWELLHRVVDEGGAVDLALFTGVQIHGPNGRNYVAPRAGYLMLGGELSVVQDLAGTGDPKPRVRRLPRWVARGAVASTVVVLVSARRGHSPRVGL